MPGGHRDPISAMAGLISSLHQVATKAKSNINDVTHKAAQENDFQIPHVDLVIQFIGANGLPKMDVVGSADPYFIAKIDDKISFVSTVKSDTLTPVWNELWKIKNVPANANLSIKVMDKDNDSVTDDYIGKFETTVNAGTKELEIEGPILHRSRGTFWLKIETTKSDPDQVTKFPYLFDGPIRYSRHFSPTVGHLTAINDAQLYSTWKMYIKGIPLFFGDVVQPWNHGYKAAQSIFEGPTSIVVRSGIQAGHRMLYARTTNNGFGVINGPEDVRALLRSGPSPNGESSYNSRMDRSPSPNRGARTPSPNTNSASCCAEKDPYAAAAVPTTTGGEGPAAAASDGTTADGTPVQAPHTHRVKPAVYTYIISKEDDSFRFSETGAAFFVDFASKHALHSNCATAVRYSGEFHPRPKGGWENFADDKTDQDTEWELVIDNNSGTYSPDKKMLPKLKELLEYNFPGFGIVAIDHEDPELKKSTDATRHYALTNRGVKEEELQPHTAEGQVTLSHMSSQRAHHAKDLAEKGVKIAAHQVKVEAINVAHPTQENHS